MYIQGYKVKYTNTLFWLSLIFLASAWSYNSKAYLILPVFCQVKIYSHCLRMNQRSLFLFNMCAVLYLFTIN